MIVVDAVKQTIVDQAERTYPDECCGALLGTESDKGERMIVRAVPIVNTFEDDEKYHRFQITADDVLRVEHSARQSGLELIGFYHSHPDHPAIPSDYDRDHAWPFYSYIVLAVEAGKAQAFRAWSLKADRSAFEEETFSLVANNG